jgi:hypothetical protein
MLGNVERAPDASPGNSSIREIASGLSAELKAELGLHAPSEDQTPSAETEQNERLDDLLESLETSLALQMEILSHSGRQSEAFDFVLEELSELSPEAQELATMIMGRHLTSAQYQSLVRNSQVSEAVKELRESGFLVPLEGYSEDGDEMLVYFFPPSTTDLVRAALLLLPDASEEVHELIVTELQKVNYPKQD